MFERMFDPYKDVIYGLSNWRDRYIDRWIEQQKREAGEKGEPFDRAKLEERARKFLINYYNKPILEINPINKYTQYGTISEIAVRNYIEQLEKTSYKPSSVRDDASVPRISKGDINIPTDKQALSTYYKNNQEVVILAAQALAIRRACKFGIEYISQIKGGTVHYVLDGIDMSNVVGKKTTRLWTGTTGIPITTSELRYLFRNWYRLKELEAQHKIIFWKNYVRFDSPWHTNPQEWMEYAKQRIDKRRAGLMASQNLIETFEKFSRIDPTLALGVFFKIPTGDTLLQE